MSDKLIRINAVLDRTGCKRWKIYDLINKGEFPKPVKIDSCALWPSSKVDRWIAEKIAASEAAG